MHGYRGRSQILGPGGAQRMHTLGCILATSLLLATSQAMADIDVGKMVERWRFEAASTQAPLGDPFLALSRRSDGVMQLLVKQRSSATPVKAGLPRPGMVSIHPGVFTWAATPEDVATLVDERPDLRISWSAPRHVLLDQAVSLVHADVARRDYALTGKGVAVGIVDTGLDVSHRDLRNRDGTSRIAWLLDMSHTPVGLHEELEAAFCSDKKKPCAVYSGTDLDALIANGVSGDEPRDSYGHGTHVASLAAGNGLASPVPKYIGMAPEATLVAVRATRDDSGIVEDADILDAVKFIFEVADKQLGLPAVANLSLGGDFGAHDGTSDLERQLSTFVGSDIAGHSIVVAAGNSGMLFHSSLLPYPNPLGIHAVTQVPYESSVRVPILIAKSVEPRLTSQLYIWVASRPGDRLKVGLETETGTWIAPVDLLEKSSKLDPSGQYVADVQNGVTESDDPASVDHAGAVVMIAGPFEADRVFALRFEGHGSASIWVQAAGGIDPMSNGMGAIIPGAQREGTVSVPATSTNLIAVGATLDHLEWTDIGGTDNLVSDYVANYFRKNEVLAFSSAGPTAVDELKPDIVAPGGLVAGAMSSLADPRTAVGAKAMFEGSDTECFAASEDCLVVDDQHALSTGTSMASPIVAGAVALLFQRDPTLTQPQILLALQAGANTVGKLYASPSQVGAGLLDVDNALLAADGVASNGEPSSVTSWIGLANSYVHPDSNWPVAGLVHLRDADNRAVDIEVERLSLTVKNGRVVSGLKREAPGYYRFKIAGAERTAGQTLYVELLLDGRRILTEERDIQVDAFKTDEVAAAGRGCAVSAPARNSAGFGALLLVLGLAVTRMRRDLRRS